MQRLRGDVAIIGGGPAGSTTAALLKKYNPDLNVMIFEREQFPRDHVGESQLPAIMAILDEMGAWEKVEASGFPVKLGGAYRWGETEEPWYLNFIEPSQYVSVPRPAKYEGQRRETAFQVDRSIYDKVLLDHARSMGVAVYENANVTSVAKSDDSVVALNVNCEELGGEAVVKAKYYVDCSGEGGTLRKAFSVQTDVPTSLRNIAFWDYWNDAKWAETIGKGATRILVMSIGWGWLWFIPVTETRTSVGLVLPAEYYRKSGKRPQEIYRDAIMSEPRVAELIENATCENLNLATKDWNFLADRLTGENWLLAGDSCGFADPILSAGMTLAHTAARKVAFTILELLRGKIDGKWLRTEYESGHRAQIKQHMQFAEFWYRGQGEFFELKEHCAVIASNSGLELTADEAFYWLASGGFAVDTPGMASAATFPLAGVKHMAETLTGTSASWAIAKVNKLIPNFQGSVEKPLAHYSKGDVIPLKCLAKGSKQLALAGAFNLLVSRLTVPIAATELLDTVIADAMKIGLYSDEFSARKGILQALEALLVEGWVLGQNDPALPTPEGKIDFYFARA
ncbi:MAG TPA: NAD(P)/FAD-dependent oxidoreductase [Fimbriimonadaceae bacterium]